MRIVNKLVELRTSYKSKSIQHDNGAILIEPSDMPKCRHMLKGNMKCSLLKKKSIAFSQTRMPLYQQASSL